MSLHILRTVDSQEFWFEPSRALSIIVKSLVVDDEEMTAIQLLLMGGHSVDYVLDHESAALTEMVLRRTCERAMDFGPNYNTAFVVIDPESKDIQAVNPLRVSMAHSVKQNDRVTSRIRVLFDDGYTQTFHVRNVSEGLRRIQAATRAVSAERRRQHL